MTKGPHPLSPSNERRFGVVLGIVGGVLLVAAFTLLRLVVAIEDAAAFSQSGATPGELTVTYAGLEAPLASSHPGMPPPARLCVVALDDGGTTRAVRIDGRACAGLHAGVRASVLTWRGRLVAVDGWATGDQPQGEVVAWTIAAVALGFVGGILTGVSLRGAGNPRPAWYYDHLER